MTLFLMGYATAVFLMALGLAGCQRGAGWHSPASSGQGRYAGVAVYPAGRMWAQLTHQRTGELCQCGNLSGVCLAMSPWAKAAVTAPAGVKQHAEDLDAQDRAQIKAAAGSR